MEVKNIIAIVIIATIITGAAIQFYEQSQVNRWVDAQGYVHYNHPSNDYEVAVEFANDICPVKEVEIADNDIGDVEGQTTFSGATGKVIDIAIEEKSPAVVYHEAFHAQHNFNDPENTEPNADAYATSKGFPIHDGTY